MSQTLLLKRIPYEGEVKEATRKEYARRQAQFPKSPFDYSKDISALQASTSEVGGRLSQLEQTIRQLILSLGDKVPQEDLILPAAGGGTLYPVAHNVTEDGAGAEDVVADISEDAAVVATEVDDVLEENGEDIEAEVDYLVDNVVDDVLKEVDVVVADSVEHPATAENSTGTPTDIAIAVVRDGSMASQVLSDPYSIGVKSVAASTRAETASTEVILCFAQAVSLNKSR
jgi:hypothetical protein